MINRAAERRLVGRSLGTSQKVLEETVNFFANTAYAIDRETQIIAWNQGMESLTGVAAKDILGKSGGAHSAQQRGWSGPKKKTS